VRITVSMPHVFHPGSTPVENARALRVMLECLIQLNLAFLKDHSALPLYKAGVVYGRTQVWDTIPSLYARGYGDCKSLSAALIAQYRHRGIAAQPVFRWTERPDGSGARDFHILVQTSRGWEDPSKVLGMGQNENAPVRG